MRTLSLWILALSGWGLGWATPAVAGPQVVRLVMARDVVAKQPVGEASRFPADGGRVFAWAHVDNTGGPAAPLVFVWSRDGREVYRKPVTVKPSPRWRTWSRRWMHPQHAGAWRVDLERADGERLGSVAFTIGEGAAPTARASGSQAPPAADPAPPPRPAPAAPVAARTPPRPGREARRSPAGTCRALVTVRHPDGRYGTVEIRPGAGRPFVVEAPGLAVIDRAGAAHALRLVSSAERLTGPEGAIDRRVQLLWGVPLAGGTPHIWAGYPSRLPRAPGEVRAEHNEITVMSVTGDHLGLRLALTGRAPDWFDNSRFVTVRAPGQPADPTLGRLPSLPAQAVQRLAALYRLTPGDAPDPGSHDFRQAAWAPAAGGLRLFTLLQGPRRAFVVDVPLQPPEGLGPTPDADGWWRAPSGCARVRAGGGAVVLQRGEQAPIAVALSGGIEALLGVHWLPAGHPWRADTQQAAWTQLAAQVDAREGPGRAPK